MRHPILLIPHPILLLLTTLLLASSVAYACGSSARPDTDDARALTTSVFDCLDATADAPDLRAGVTRCAPHARAAIAIFCKSELIPSGPICDAVVPQQPSITTPPTVDTAPAPTEPAPASTPMPAVSEPTGAVHRWPTPTDDYAEVSGRWYMRSATRRVLSALPGRPPQSTGGCEVSRVARVQLVTHS